MYAFQSIKIKQKGNISVVYVLVFKFIEGLTLRAFEKTKHHSTWKSEVQKQLDECAQGLAEGCFYRTDSHPNNIMVTLQAAYNSCPILKIFIVDFASFRFDVGLSVAKYS